MRIRKWFEAKAAKPRFMTSLFPGRCRHCGNVINDGDEIFWVPKYRTVYCTRCAEEIKQVLEGEE